jgi:D-alanine-D-alanine ligase-like ATP-grasp enzyme
MVAIELDVEYDKKVLREVLIAGDDAKVADIVKAPLFVKPDEQ